MIYKDRKVIFCSPDGDTDYSHMVVVILHGDTLAQILFIICRDYVQRNSIDQMK